MLGQFETTMDEATIDRRGSERRNRLPQRLAGERRADQPSSTTGEAYLPEARPVVERRAKVERRRQIDPTTCERDYSGDEVEFMKAMDDYKRRSGRMFPTWSEVLEVVRSLGYTRD